MPEATDAETDAEKKAERKLDGWYRSTVIYELDVENFQDSNGDGVGDFRGLISRLDYLKDLGVGCLWLQPFYPSPSRDDGYDVSDYCDVDPRLGTLEDFDAFIKEASARGLRVIGDLPLNHTSDRHSWFKAARQDRNSPYRGYYIWSDTLPADPAPFPVFGEGQHGNWQWDGAAGQYYFHTFYPFQPNLNVANPAVQKQLLDVVTFWMKRGLSGFRLDAVPFLVKDRAPGAELADPKEFLRDIRNAADDVCERAVLLAEVNLEPDRLSHYFGNGDEMHLLLNFWMCNHMFVALATADARHISKAWQVLPEPPNGCGWGNFVRNHDELNLSRLEPAEREAVFKAFGPDADMQLYGRGLRRRFAPMVDGDPRRIRLMYALLLSLPGTPVVNMGEEIGLGDDLRLPDRQSVRTPMQWTAEMPNAGYSTAPPERLRRPVISEGPFGLAHVNVAQQEKDADSLLNFFRRAIRAYRSTSSFDTKDWSFVDVSDPAVLAHHCDCESEVIYAFHNLSDEAKSFATRVPEQIEELFSDDDYAPVTAGNLVLRPYGFRWFRAKGNSKGTQA